MVKRAPEFRFRFRCVEDSWEERCAVDITTRMKWSSEGGGEMYGVNVGKCRPCGWNEEIRALISQKETRVWKDGEPRGWGMRSTACKLYAYLRDRTSFVLLIALVTQSKVVMMITS